MQEKVFSLIIRCSRHVSVLHCFGAKKGIAFVKYRFGNIAL